MSPRVWLITGVSSGLGLELALHAASQGDIVIGASCTPRSLSHLHSKSITPAYLDQSAPLPEIQAAIEQILTLHNKMTSLLLEHAVYLLLSKSYRHIRKLYELRPQLSFNCLCFHWQRYNGKAIFLSITNIEKCFSMLDLAAVARSKPPPPSQQAKRPSIPADEPPSYPSSTLKRLQQLPLMRLQRIQINPPMHSAHITRGRISPNTTIMLLVPSDRSTFPLIVRVKGCTDCLTS